MEAPIIGGSEAQPGAWPSAVALYRDGSTRQICTGTIVADQWVLTAGHCLKSAMTGIDSVVIGRHDLTSAEGESIRVTQVLRHPGYRELNTSKVADNDIALLRLERPTLAPTAQLIDVAHHEAIVADADVTAVGWGLINMALVKDTDVLREVTVPVITKDECAAAADGDYGRLLSDNMICTGSRGNHESICLGDSGGPLFMVMAGHPVQVGITSWGSCGTRNQPSVYTRLGNYLDWLSTVSEGAIHPTRP